VLQPTQRKPVEVLLYVPLGQFTQQSKDPVVDDVPGTVHCTQLALPMFAVLRPKVWIERSEFENNKQA